MSKNKENPYIIFHGEINIQNTTRLIAACNQLVDDGAKHIYIAFSSNGGAINSGINLYNTLKAMNVEITIHNTGSIESVAVIVFFAGNNRYVSEQSRFLIHEPVRKFFANETLTAARLSELTQQLINDEKILSDLMEQNTSASKGTISRWFRKAKVIDSKTAIANSFASDIVEFRIPITSNIITLDTKAI